MDKKEFDNYIKAAEISIKARSLAEKLLKPGVKLFDVATQVEDLIIKEGGFPAFPINLSIDNQAAHNTPSIGDETVLKEKNIVKIDIGVHIDGYICDSAFTINNSGEWKELIKINKEALDAGVKAFGIGVQLSEIGKAIEEVVKSYDFNVVHNLTGHGLERFVQHAYPSIPNYASNNSYEIENNKVYAIEPFITNGKGFIHEESRTEIFALDSGKPVRSAHGRKVLNLIKEKYEKVPFAERWLEELGLSEFARKTALMELMRAKSIRAYPVLAEEKEKIVSQAETTLVVSDGKITRLI